MVGMESLTIEYFWQELLPDPGLSGEGVIHYDPDLMGYALHNRFAGSDRLLDYVLDEKQGLAWVSEFRDGVRRCHEHETDRRVALHRHLEEGRRLGEGILQGVKVSIIEWQEPGDHDRWIWYVGEDGQPLRFLTWTHHGQILILHDVHRFERIWGHDPAEFRPREEWGCG